MIQYGDQFDDPERRASYGSLLYRPARYYDYSIQALNLPGPFPRVPGVPSYRSDPYSYQVEDFDELGGLGKFEWTRRTQLLPVDVEFPLHRAFVPLDLTAYEFDIRKHVVQARGPDQSLRVLERAYIEKAMSAGQGLARCLQRIRDVSLSSKVELLSEPDPDWHFGASWMRLLRLAGEPQQPWRAVLVAQELRRRIVDGVGYVCMATRVFIYFLGYQTLHEPARFRTTTRMAGLIVDMDNARSRQIGEGLADLGVPVWGMRILDPKPKLELIPRQSTHESPMWKEAYEEERPRMRIVPEPTWLTDRVQSKFELKLGDLYTRKLCHPITNRWSIQRGHPKQADKPGPYYRFHEAYQKELKKFGNEDYYECVLKWLQAAPRIGASLVLTEFRRAFGEATIPSATLSGSRFPPIQPIFHRNYHLLEELAHQSAYEWTRPTAYPTIPYGSSLADRIAKPRARAFGAPEETGLGSRHPRSASPEERRVRHKRAHQPSTSKAKAPLPPDDDELSPYEDDEYERDANADELSPLEEPGSYRDTESTPHEDLTMPSDVKEAASERGKDQVNDPAPQPLDPSVIWGASCHERRLFPVELSPFVYFGEKDYMERELCVRYQGIAVAWRLDGSHLFLVFNNKDGALRVIRNQQRAAAQFPTEPSAQAIPLPPTTDLFQPWSAHVIAFNEETVRVLREHRLTNWPPLPSTAIPAARGRDAITASIRHFINPSAASSSPAPSAGENYHLMSRYAMSAGRLMKSLNERIAWLTKAGVPSNNQGREATELLRNLLSRHLAYEQPTAFRFPIPLAGPSRDLFVWIVDQLPPVEPTSLLARGTYNMELFTWSNAREEYEIVLDNLSLEDVGFSLGDPDSL